VINKLNLSAHRVHEWTRSTCFCCLCGCYFSVSLPTVCTIRSVCCSYWLRCHLICYNRCSSRRSVKVRNRLVSAYMCPH